MGRTLGILVLSNSESPDIQTVQGLCQAAKEMGVEVEIFFMGEAVNRLRDPELQLLTEEGATLSFCALNAIEKRLDQHPQYPWGFEEGSQYTLACMVEESDRFLAFT